MPRAKRIHFKEDEKIATLHHSLAVTTISGYSIIQMHRTWNAGNLKENENPLKQQR
jgi:hypothetical protein